MLRRTFFRSLLGSALLPLASQAVPPTRSVLLQESPLAGFQYHQGHRLWPALSVGDPLTLVREPGNRHDPRAVAVHWHGRKLGYLPRVENTAAAQLLDREAHLTALIVALSDRGGPWQRIRLALYLAA